MIRAEQYLELVERYTSATTRPPVACLASGSSDARRQRGRTRYLVKYRLGGRESAQRCAGSFATRRDALARQRWVAGELAALRVPRLGQLGEKRPGRPPSPRRQSAGARPEST